MMTQTKWQLLPICCLAAILAIPVPFAVGGGFQVTSQGARATAQGEAYTAQADDPSAIYYNPAGLVQLPGTQLTAGLYAVDPHFEFDSDGGDQQTTKAAYLPHFYAVTDLGLKDWRVGLGVNNAFGVSEDWGDTGPLSTIVTSASLSVINIAPTVAYRLNDQLSLGLGANVYYGDLDVKNRAPLSADSAGTFHLDGEGTAVGATAGVLWKINPQNSVGLVYRSPFSINFDGSAKVKQGDADIVGPSDTDETITFPQIVVVGYAYRPTPKLKVETDVQWADWQTLNDVKMHSTNPAFGAVPARQLDYESTFSYRLGAQYDLTPRWALRAGYIYSPSSTPDRTLSPLIVDLDSHVFTAGVGYSRPNWGIDLAYRYILGVSQRVDNSVNSPPGRYSDHTQTLMISLTLRS